MAALLEKLATKKRGRFVAMRELILDCRESFRRERLLSGILDELTEGARFLVLDDFGAEKPSEFARETLELLIDRSYAGRQWQPIVTSNLDLDQLIRCVGERIADRLRELCVTVRLGGASYRRRIAARRAWQAKGEGGQNL
jgi:DNA replication protein DnaC